MAHRVHSSKPQKTHLLSFRSISMPHWTVLPIRASQCLHEATTPKGIWEPACAGRTCRWAACRRNVLGPTQHHPPDPTIGHTINHWPGAGSPHQNKGTTEAPWCWLGRMASCSLAGGERCWGSSHCQAPQQPWQAMEQTMERVHRAVPLPMSRDEQKGLSGTKSLGSKLLRGQSGKAEAKQQPGTARYPTRFRAMVTASSPQLF